MSQQLKVIIIGAGAAGLFAAGTAASYGADVTIIEKNERPGKKLLITGKGRCNLTNEADMETFIRNFPDTGRFLYSALSTFSNVDVIDFFERYRVPTQVERGGRIFPKSGVARDVVTALVNYTKDSGVKYVFKDPCQKIVSKNDRVIGIKTVSGDYYPAERVILATGGLSYPRTGSTGDGYQLAEQLGHTINPVLPSLVPLVTKEKWVTELQGLSLRNVRLSLFTEERFFEKRLLTEEFGEMLFTDYGISGPIVLRMSRDVIPFLKTGHVKASLDLKPALPLEKLDQRLRRDFEKYARRDFKNALGDLLPRLLIPVIIRLSKIPEEKKVHQITANERIQLAKLIKNLNFVINGHRGFNEAIVTRGGVNIKEIFPKTMQSRLISGLYIVGELLDLDGYTGGYNLQAAFSTGYLAGISAAQG